MAWEAFSRCLSAAILACCCISIGCGWNAGADDVSVVWTITPAPPVTGVDTIAHITLRDGQRQPLHGANLRLEAHMSHPGMTPVTTGVVERGEGVYEGHFRFSMAGDWTLVVTGTLPDGSRITRQLDISGVRTAG